MKIDRRQACRLMAALTTAWLAAAAGFAHAQGTYPAKPIRFLVGFAPGGAADVVARTVAGELANILGQSVVVDNRPGAGAHLATQALLAAPADGYTLLFAGLSLATNPGLIPDLGYRPTQDLTMVSQLTSIPVVVLAPAKSPMNGLQDVVAEARKRPEGLNFGSGGVGTSGHLGPELFARVAGFKYTHVPYKGGAPALQGLIAGETDVMYDIGITPALRGMVAAGRVKILGVMQRDPIPGFPEARSAGQQGIPAEAFMTSWQGVAVRSGTPPEIVARLHAAITTALSRKEVVEKLEAAGTIVEPSRDPRDFQKLYLDELARWTQLIKAAGLKAQ